jgi:hypothetical protein
MYPYPHLSGGCFPGRSSVTWKRLYFYRIPSRNFVEVRWRSLFRSTSLGKRCTSYNAPLTSRKSAADRWSLRNSFPRSSIFMVGKAQKSHGAKSGLYGGCSNGVPSIHFFQAEHRIEFGSRPHAISWLFQPWKGSSKANISKWSTVYSTFSRNGWSGVGSASLAKRGTSKKRLPSHLYKVPTRSNKMSPRTLQTTLVYYESNRYRTKCSTGISCNFSFHNAQNNFLFVQQLLCH